MMTIRPLLRLLFVVVVGFGVGLGCGAGSREAARPTAPSTSSVLSEGQAVAASSPGRASPAPAERDRAAPTEAAASDATASERTAIDEALVVEGWITLEVRDVQAAAQTIRARAQSAGGRVINERLSGAELSWSGTLNLRLPPADVDDFTSWLGDLGEVTSRRIQGTDVSRELFDQEIALENLELTLERLRALLDREELEMREILSIENEMTRLRGEIERIKGENRWLRDRVALATLEIRLERKEGAVLGARAKFYPGLRGSMLTLLDPDGRSRNRLGAGIVIHPFAPGGTEATSSRMTLEADVFQGADGGNAAALFTIGGAAYSDFLGRGRNLVGNPYIGLRTGYAYLDRSAFALAATAGIELFKTRYVLFDVNVRGVGLFGRGGFEPAVVTGANLVFAF